MAEVRTAQVWREIERQVFAVVGMVSARGHGRTAGVVHVVRDGGLWFLTDADAWKVRHIKANPEVSVTVPIPKRIPFLPWIRIPSATVTFAGTATVYPRKEIAPDVWHALTHGLEMGDEKAVGVRIAPHGDFVTYGVGVSLLGMRDTTRARGRTPVRCAAADPASPRNHSGGATSGGAGAPPSTRSRDGTARRVASPTVR